MTNHTREEKIIAIANEYAADGCILPLKIAIEELFVKKKRKTQVYSRAIPCTQCSRIFRNEAGMKIHRSYVHYKFKETKDRIIQKRMQMLM